MKTGEILKSFLAHLSPPLCLVAHNGDKYDFPFLKAELEKVGITHPSNNWFADLYLGIREIISRNEEVMHSNTENITEDQLNKEINDVSLTKLLDSEYGVIERENSKNPTKTSFSKNNIDAVHCMFTSLTKIHLETLNIQD